MERLTGKDLEQEAGGHPLGIAEACTLAYQIASALDEAHRHQLVHRDIKPSNVFVTQNRQAKLLDFGLVRHLRGDAFTTPDVVLGTLEYMAPEQASDATQVDIRTDVFGLGATLFFALTGASAFPIQGKLLDAIRRRQTQAPLQARSLREEIPEELEDVLQHMIALRPADRLPTPEAVMHALLPFLDSRPRHEPPRIVQDQVGCERPAEAAPTMARPCVVVADANSEVRRRLVQLLTGKGMNCVEARDGASALQLLRSESSAAVLLAVHLPGTDGPAILRALRDNPPCANLKVLMTAPAYSADEMASLLNSGADDYLPMSLSNVQLAARVHAAVQHKAVQDRTDQLSRQLLELNSELERNLSIRTTDLVQAQCPGARPRPARGIPLD